MPRTTTVLLAVVLVIGSVSAFPVAAAAQTTGSVTSAIDTTTHAQVDENASDTAKNVTAGERLSAIIGVSQAEFEGEVEQRAYGIEFARAASADDKAQVVADRFDRIQERLDELETEKEELEAAHENGEIDEGEFQARMAKLSARMETVEQLANASEARANSLPSDVLEANGVNVTAIQTLKTQAEELSGGEVSRIARSIAGDDVGQSVSQGPPSEIGMPSPDQTGDGDMGDAQSAIDRAEEQLNASEERLNQAEERVGENGSDNATAALEQAREELERARQALEDARSALEAGNEDEALDLAADALSHAEQAEQHAQDALDEAGQSGQDGTDTGTDSGSSTGDGSQTTETSG